MSKFKVGDKVKVVKTGLGFASENSGNIYTIESVGEYPRVPPSNHSGIGYRVEGYRNTGFDGYVGEGSFELVEPEVTYEHVKKPYKEIPVGGIIISPKGRLSVKQSEGTHRSLEPTTLGWKLPVDIAGLYTHIEGLTYEDIYESILSVVGIEDSS